MATIEPRLIHLLNESTSTPKPGHAELPPIKGLNLPQSSSSTSLPQLVEPEVSRRLEHNPDQNGAQPVRHPPYGAGDDGHTGSLTRPDSTGHLADRSLVTHVSSQDLRMILDDNPDLALDDLANKKRPNKEDFVQLPQPLKKQKATAQQPHTFPPIIVGLLEPPDRAALLSLPPISFDGRPQSDTHGEASSTSGGPTAVEGQPSVASTDQQSQSSAPDPERTPTGKPKRKAAKPRRKWSEEETNHLLLGVSKHGVGRWTDIMEDPEYNFHDRSAGDLKDRFRTCCPAELRDDLLAKKADATGRDDISGQALAVRKPTKGLMSENILNRDDDVEAEPSSQPELDPSGPKQRKSRAHRKKLEDLVELGIKGPFKKSHRRERRPFSEQDDREILEGFELYGPQWTKIQRDPRYHLSSRQPTDLRDRLRNKYPERFPGTEKTALHVKGDQSAQASTLEPSVNMTIGNSLNAARSTQKPNPQLDRTHSKEEIPRFSAHSSFTDSADYIPPMSHSVWTDNPIPGFHTGAMGEMDISRLLLDDTHSFVDTSTSDRRGLS
ncbi:uncharacterized protein B0I36DRAFT_62169 [Microdochium trichocladiopsis]|uniref:Myb-like domain-containing protein n=1 Tax=Microdochium trichocladiopsis TaxID=1682393 RepID=A0A9P9BXK5_9PEZI|nr:uncharacterized protein B0I36DRAFT_62169 [Microdochium trichocladiopsis]KAH7037138.1 hypothetical protein B0I36DRAFT_62169 [Microdochium trichocladiopsis]